MKPPVKFGLIGAGSIAQTYAQAFDGWNGAKLAAVADTRPEVAQAMAETLKAAAFTAHQAMLAGGPPLDAVIVCTPPDSHEAIVKACVDRKLHVLCEKPFTLDTASARRMVAAAEAAGVKLTMASKFRYCDDVVRAKSIVTSGILGEIHAVENAFAAKVDMANRWNSNPKVAGGGVLIDNGTHSVDIIRYFLGPITEVLAIEGKRIQNLPVEDTVQLFVRSAGGVTGHIDLTWSINKELDWFLSVFGNNGVIQVGWKESRYRQQSSRDWIVFGKGYNKVQAFRSELTNFADYIHGEDRLLINAEDAVASVEVIEAAYRSVPRARWEPVANGEVRPQLEVRR